MYEFTSDGTLSDCRILGAILRNFYPTLIIFLIHGINDAVCHLQESIYSLD